MFATITGFSVDRLSYMLYGDPTFTGRTIIWDFAHLKIARKPMLGWGYQSFWLVGPDGPSVLDGPGWVKEMPNAHNGYLDTMLEMGYVGLLLLVTFIAATLHAIGRMADRDFARAWLVLSLALYIIVTNGLESLWMRGFEMMWIVFLILVAEIGRHWRPLLSSQASVHGGEETATGQSQFRARRVEARCRAQRALTSFIHSDFTRAAVLVVLAERAHCRIGTTINRNAAPRGMVAVTPDCSLNLRSA